MAKKVKRNTRRISERRRTAKSASPFIWTIVLLVGLLFGIVVTMIAVSRPTPAPPHASACNDSGCANVVWQHNPPVYQITNCDPSVTVCDANGDQQICISNKIGMCGGKQYCCPGAGQQWTTNMSACAGLPPYVSACVTQTQTQTPAATNTPTYTPTPTTTTAPSQNTVPTCSGLTTNVSSSVTAPATITLTCLGVDPDGYVNGAQFTFGDGSSQTLTRNVGSPGSISISHTYNSAGTESLTCMVEDNNSAWSNSCQATITVNSAITAAPTYTYVTYNTPTNTPLPTPTPTYYILSYCNQSCTNNLDCPGGLICVPTGNSTQGCRNAFCSSASSCLCSEESGMGSLAVVPTIAEANPPGSGRQIPLSVSSFFDKNGNTNSKPNICGISEAGATIDISIFPDAVNGEVTADTSGKWCYQPPKPLSAGKKSLLVVAKKADGQGQLSLTFNVIAPTTSGISYGWIILILILIAVGFGGYVYYKSM